MRVEILAGLKTVFHSIFGNKAKGRISNGCFKKTKHTNFRKNLHFCLINDSMRYLHEESWLLVSFLLSVSAKVLKEQENQ